MEASSYANVGVFPHEPHTSHEHINMLPSGKFGNLRYVIFEDTDDINLTGPGGDAAPTV